MGDAARRLRNGGNSGAAFVRLTVAPITAGEFMDQGFNGSESGRFRAAAYSEGGLSADGRPKQRSFAQNVGSLANRLVQTNGGTPTPAPQVIAPEIQISAEPAVAPTAEAALDAG